MQDMFPGPEAMNAARMLLHAFKGLSDSLPFFERQEAEEKLLRELINLGATPIHEAAPQGGYIELSAAHGATMGEAEQEAVRGAYGWAYGAGVPYRRIGT